MVLLVQVVEECLEMALGEELGEVQGAVGSRQCTVCSVNYAVCIFQLYIFVFNFLGLHFLFGSLQFVVCSL